MRNRQKGAVFSALILCVFLHSSSSLAKNELPLVAVFPVLSRDVGSQVGAEKSTQSVPPFVIRAAIQASLEETSSFRVLAEQDRLLLLEDAAGLGIVCENGDSDCWVKVGLLGAVDFFLFPVLEDPEFQLSVVDVAKTMAKTTTRPLTYSTAAIQVRSAVVEVIAPERFTGDLSVVTEPAGAMIYLDDEVISPSPLQRAGPFPAGPHLLRVEIDGQSRQKEIRIPLEGHLQVSLSFKSLHDDKTVEKAETSGKKIGATLPKEPKEKEETQASAPRILSPLFLSSAGLAGISFVAFVGFSIGVVVIESIATVELGVSLSSRAQHENQKLYGELKDASLILYPGAGIFALATTVGLVGAGSAWLVSAEAE